MKSLIRNVLALQVYIQLEIYVPITIVTKNEQTNLGSQFDWTLKIDLYWRIRQQYYNPVCLSQMAHRSHRSRKRRAFSTISKAPTTWISDRLICIQHRQHAEQKKTRKGRSVSQTKLFDFPIFCPSFDTFGAVIGRLF